MDFMMKRLIDKNNCKACARSELPVKFLDSSSAGMLNAKWNSEVYRVFLHWYFLMQIWVEHSLKKAAKRSFSVWYCRHYSATGYDVSAQIGVPVARQSDQRAVLHWQPLGGENRRFWPSSVSGQTGFLRGHQASLKWWLDHLTVQLKFLLFDWSDAACLYWNCRCLWRNTIIWLHLTRAWRVIKYV